MSESTKGDEKDDQEGDASTNLPELSLGPACINKVAQIHAEIGCEEAEREENNGDACEDHNGRVLRVAYDGHVVLFYAAELEKLD